MQDSEYLYKDKVVEYHDFMVEDDSEVYVPPTVMEGYVPGDSYIPITKVEKVCKVCTEIKAVLFGSAVAFVYSIFSFIGLSK